MRENYVSARLGESLDDSLRRPQGTTVGDSDYPTLTTSTIIHAG